MPERPRSVPVYRDEVVELRVDDFGDGPDGLCRIDGYVIFVAETLPGELVRVRISSASRKFGRGELLEVIEPSPDRVRPICPHFGPCGGCQLQHLSPTAQVAAKEVRLRRTLAHALRTSPGSVALGNSRFPADASGQRTKLALHFGEQDGELVAGYFGRRGRDLVPIDVCPVQERRGLEVALAARDGLRQTDLRAFDPHTGRGDVRAVVVRSSERTHAIHATLVVAHEGVRVGALGPAIDAMRAAGATGAALNLNDGPPDRLLGERMRSLFGVQHVDDEVHGIHYRTSAGAFFQTSIFGVDALVEEVRAAVGEVPADSHVADLYCGSGLFALALAGQVGQVFGIEEDERAVEDAVQAAEAAGIQNVRFRAGRVEGLISNLARMRDKPHAVIVDPPRAGCDARVLARVADRLQPRRLVYVSCDPDSLGRDAGRLRDLGYTFRRAVMVDMFPHTAHLETVAVFDRTVRRRDPARERLLARVQAEGPKRG
jgi:23S rRNA (uracil1939-C5)-methyltransferase